MIIYIYYIQPATATLKSVRTRSLNKLGLDYLAPNASAVAYYNLSYGEIADHQARNKEGIFTSCVQKG